MKVSLKTLSMSTWKWNEGVSYLLSSRDSRWLYTCHISDTAAAHVKSELFGLLISYIRKID